MRKVDPLVHLRAAGKGQLMSTQRRLPRRLGLVASAVFIGLVGATLPAVAANATPSIPEEWIDEQVDFILSKQLDDGAILGVTRSGYIDINPYFSNIAALGLLAADTTASRAGALDWMEWYLDHLNAAATNVPANSVFDYRYYPATDTQVSTGDFDSVDSYASTTLNVAWAAYQSGDPALQTFVTNNITTYEAIANILNYGAPTGVRIESPTAGAGLTIAKPSYPIAYTMDNTEVFSGLRDFADLQSALGRTSEAAYYGAWTATSQDAVTDLLWNPTNDNWDWAYLNTSNTDVFYAQGAAQLWPILDRVVPATDAKAVAGWTQFTASWPDWYNNGVPDAYPWISLARAAQLMGEWDNAAAHLVDAHERYAPGGFTQPTSCGASTCGMWYVAEAGWFIQAALADNGNSVSAQPAVSVAALALAATAKVVARLIEKPAGLRPAVLRFV